MTENEAKVKVPTTEPARARGSLGGGALLPLQVEREELLPAAPLSEPGGLALFPLRREAHLLVVN